MLLSHLQPHQLKQAIDERWPLLVPAGCVEYHGPHLPLGVDTLIGQELLRRVALRVPCVIAPPFEYGPTGYAVSGPERGTVDVSTERFGRHVKDVLNSFCDVGWRWMIVCQHHQQLDGPQALAIRTAAAEVMFERAHAERGHAWWGSAPLPPDDNVFERIQIWPSVLPAAAEQGVQMADHAGFYETALILAAHPDLVDLNRLGMDAPWYTNASGSRARQATQPAGEQMWQAMAEAWVVKLSALARPKRLTPEDLTITGLF